MNVIVTGGAGFIGSHLCKKLIDKKYFVICVDNLFTGNLDNIRELLKNRNFKFIKEDVVKSPSRYLRISGAEQIYHLACPASPVHYQFDPIKTAQTSFLGTYNYLELAEKLKAKFLLTSTSEVYGDPSVHPQKESYWGNVNPHGIRSCYDEGKRIAETLTMDFHRRRKVRIAIARIFNTYGPNMHPDDGRVVSNFIVQKLKKLSLTVYGKGEQTRSFCYVSDMVDGLLELMSQDATIGPVNIGNPKEFTILELAREVSKLIGGETKIIHKPLPEDDPK